MTTAAIKSRPILFSGPMVRAILDGRKSQTRRIVKNGGPCAVDPRFHPAEDVARELAQDLRSLAKRCPYGAPGDELWVRETFQSGRGLLACVHVDYLGFPVVPDEATKASPWIYAADGAELPPGLRWRSPILMPREASRLTLVVKSVRVERLSAITDEDAKAEGVGGCVDCGIKRDVNAHRCDFIEGFRALNKLAVDADPWVWVIEFERNQGGAA